MTPLLLRVRRVMQKLTLRLRLARLMALEFEDTMPRSRVRVSFSQCGEDIIAWWLLNELGIAQPRYLDIGAHHPTYLSNTALFYLLGARGINIEPDPALFREFPRHRAGDVNLNIGIAPVAGVLTFYRMRDPSLNTFSATEARRMAEEEGIPMVAEDKIPVENINELLERLNFTPDLLSIDVEGHDLPILQNYDFSRRRPAVICAESLSFSTRRAGQKATTLISHLQQQGYVVRADTHINTLFVDAGRLAGRK